MKKFQRARALNELIALCEGRQWSVYPEKYEAGSDFITIAFKHEGVSGTAYVSMFNGRFFGTLENGERFSSDHDTHDEEPWFNALLDAVYIPLPQATIL